MDDEGERPSTFSISSHVVSDALGHRDRNTGWNEKSGESDNAESNEEESLNGEC